MEKNSIEFPNVIFLANNLQADDLSTLSSRNSESDVVYIKQDAAPFSDRLFMGFFRLMQHRVHETALAHGWWEKERNDGECIALMHSELSEALEELRLVVIHDPDYDEDVLIAEQKQKVALEFADVIIRIMDFAQVRGYDVASAIVEKNAINEARPYKHGKKF